MTLPKDKVVLVTSGSSGRGGGTGRSLAVCRCSFIRSGNSMIVDGGITAATRVMSDAALMRLGRCFRAATSYLVRLAGIHLSWNAHWRRK